MSHLLIPMHRWQMSLAACDKDPIKPQKLQWSLYMNNASPPFSSFHPLSSYGLYFLLSLCTWIDKRHRFPLRGACLTKPAYRLSSSASFFLCGSSDRAGQLWSKIYLQNLIRQFSQSLLLGRCGPGGARTEDGRQEETQLSIGGSRRERLWR